MPSDDYTSAVRGGLKLKGPKPAGIKKKKKSKDSSSTTTTSASSSAIQKALAAEDTALSASAKGGKSGEEGKLEDGREDALRDEKLRELDPTGDDGKTASERAYEEMRRKRLQDRLAKEGVKTHKQKVEELNKYLSNLSEHHDMPRIGPG